MAGLLCLENLGGTVKALYDDIIAKGEEVLCCMLNLENRYLPRYNYFGSIQTVITPSYRQICAIWMLELTEIYEFEDTVFPVAMSIMDRFLCLVPLTKQQLVITACVALIIAAKLRSTRRFPRALFVHQSDNRVTMSQLTKWELLVANKLNWDLETVTCNDFVDQIVNRVPAIHKHKHSTLIQSHAHVLAHLTMTDSDAITTPPSVIGTAAVLGSLRGLTLDIVSPRELCQISGADIRAIEEIVVVTEHLVRNYSPLLHTTLQRVLIS